MRVNNHPILEINQNRKEVTFYYNDKPIKAFEGDMIAFALMSVGIKSFRTTHKHKEPRGIFCAIGRCTDCMMIVDGVPNTRTCITLVKEGMRVETQHGLAPLKR